MGHMSHHTMVLVTWNEEHMKKAHDLAVSIFEHLVSDIIETKMNSYRSFFVSPDGSKEGWEDSDINNKKRAEFIGKLENLNLYIDWFECKFGGDSFMDVNICNFGGYFEEYQEDGNLDPLQPAFKGIFKKAVEMIAWNNKCGVKDILDWPVSKFNEEMGKLVDNG